MSTLVTDCPRCGAQKITFDTYKGVPTDVPGADWQLGYEVFTECRRCHRTTTFILRIRDYKLKEVATQRDVWTGEINLNRLFEVLGFISLKDAHAIDPPEHIPADLEAPFREGATCVAVSCFNAASTMFRLCLDKATRPLLPNEGEEGVAQPNSKQRRDLGLRIRWLIEQGRLPASLAGLAAAVREDGNDAAHMGNLTKEDAEDLLDFTTLLIERLYGEPERIRLAEHRRVKRRTDT